MWRSFSKRMSVTAVLASTAALAAFPGAAAAAETVKFPPGKACSFKLQVDITGGDQGIDRTFVDANENPVRILSGGRGSQFTFTNLKTGATIAFPAKGSISDTVINADGSQTSTVTGQSVLILFPTDEPEGPSTTLYDGRVVFTVNVKGVYTLVSTSGTATDICAALS